MKKISFLTFSTIFITCWANAVSITPYIVNGTSAHVNDYPSFASLYTYMDLADGSYSVRHRCGATIIDEWHVLTAAHCVIGNNVSKADKEFMVILPQLQNKAAFDSPSEYESMTKYWIEKIYTHKDYLLTSRTANNDIAVIKLEQPMTLSSHNKIRYAPDESYRLVTSDEFTAVGHGVTFTNLGRTILQKTSLKIYARSSNCGYDTPRPNTQLCMFSDNIVEGLENAVCDGDSGGPLYWTSGGIQYQVGITSYGPGLLCGSVEDMASSIFTEVKDYESWILSIINNRPLNVITYTTSELERNKLRLATKGSEENDSGDSGAGDSGEVPSKGNTSGSGGSMSIWGWIFLVFITRKKARSY